MPNQFLEVGDKIVFEDSFAIAFTKGVKYDVFKYNDEFVVEDDDGDLQFIDSWVLRTYEVIKDEPLEDEEFAQNKYHREIKPGVWVDVYDVLNAFNVTDPALAHLVKKALAVGQRGHKDEAEDYQDIYDSAKRALEMYKEWN